LLLGYGLPLWRGHPLLTKKSYMNRSFSDGLVFCPQVFKNSVTVFSPTSYPFPQFSPLARPIVLYRLPCYWDFPLSFLAFPPFLDGPFYSFLPRETAFISPGDVVHSAFPRFFFGNGILMGHVFLMRSPFFFLQRVLQVRFL